MAENPEYTVVFPPSWGDALFPALVEYRDLLLVCKTCDAHWPAFVCGVCNGAWCGKCEGSGTTPQSLQKIMSDTMAGTRVNDLFYELRCCYDCKLAKRVEATQPGRPSSLFRIYHPNSGALMPFVRGMIQIAGPGEKASTTVPSATGPVVHAGNCIVCPCHLAPPQESTAATAEPSSTSSEEDYAGVELLPAPQPPGRG